MGDRAVHIAIHMFTSIVTRIAYVCKSIVAYEELGKTTNYNPMGVYNQRQKLSFIFRDNFVLLSVWYSPAIYDCHPCLL